MIYLRIHGFMIVQSYTCKIMTMINDSCQHRCGTTFTNKRLMFFFLLYENSAVCGKKEHHWSRASNGWLHFVDLFRLSDSDIERTTICTILAQPWWAKRSRLGTLFSRDLERLHERETHFENEVSTRTGLKEKPIDRHAIRNERVKYHKLTYVITKKADHSYWPE